MKKKDQSQEEFERIERYLTGIMDEGERSDFEAALKADDNLSRQVEEARVLFQAVEEQSLRNKLEDFHEELSSGQPQLKSNKSIEKSSFNIKYLAIAASLALLMGFGYWLLFGQMSADEKLFAQYFKPDPGLITPMSTTSDYEFYRGMVDYKQGNYDMAIARWNTLIEQNPENDTLNYFLGISYLAQDENEKAIAYLSKAVKSPNSIFINESWYYLGMAQLKEGNTGDAILSLRKSGLENSKLVLQEIVQTGKKHKAPVGN